jgi:hypothetical protein
VTVVFTATVDLVGGNPPISQTMVNSADFSSANLNAGSAAVTFTVGLTQRLIYLPLLQK